eukprot:366054-Chlamydomonas_euryale.AAC.4
MGQQRHTRECLGFADWRTQRRWALLEGQMLGTGSYAKVFQGVEQATGRRAAIKVRVGHT